jgi:hypothetical protein
MLLKLIRSVRFSLEEKKKKKTPASSFRLGLRHSEFYALMVY